MNVIASPVEKRGKQSPFLMLARKIRDCFVASLLAMTSWGLRLRSRNPRPVIASGAKQSLLVAPMAGLYYRRIAFPRNVGQ